MSQSFSKKIAPETFSTFMYIHCALIYFEKFVTTENQKTKTSKPEDSIDLVINLISTGILFNILVIIFPFYPPQLSADYER